MSQASAQSARAIFFDLDGTLLDSLPGIEFSIRQAFSACELPMREIQVQQLIGPPIRRILASCAQEATEAELDLLEASFRRSYDSEGWHKTLHFPGSSDALRELHALGIRLFVVSNKPRHISVQILEREGVLPLFTRILTRDSALPHFPDKAAMLTSLLQEFQIEPQRSIMVGDTAEDAHAAHVTLIPFILMTHGYGDVQQGSVPLVSLRLGSFAELVAALKKEYVQ